MVEAAIHNFKPLKRGDVRNAFKLVMWRNAAHTIPINCTGIRILMQARKSKFDPVVFEWCTDNDTITVENDNELVFAKNTKQQTDVEAFPYKYDIEFEFEIDEPVTMVEGIIPITNDISKKWT